ncbi:hypothetical protein DV737_g2783, partial [Chaetothyriales sp. CBS 132003]
MAEPEVDDEDLFADLYEGDDNKQELKDQIPVSAQPEPAAPEAHADAPGYGVEPETGHDPTSFDTEAMDQTPGTNGAEYDSKADQDRDYRAESPGIQMKEDGLLCVLFMFGLALTMTESLHDYFSQFGEVQECTVMRDGSTGRSRGFGFLTFKDPKTVNTVMAKEHFLDGKIVRATLFAPIPEHRWSLGSIIKQRRLKTRLKTRSYRHPSSSLRSSPYLHDCPGPEDPSLLLQQIDPKRAIPKDEQEKTAKIFVGGVSQDATEAQFTEFFDKFGRVIDATLMMDKDTGRPRGFGFVTFDSDSAVERVLAHHPLEILGKPIEVKRAQPRGKIGDEEDFSRAGRGRGTKFGRDDRFGDNQLNQNQNQNQGQMGMNGMSPQMMAQYWQRMQQYFQMMQQQMMANAMGGNSPNPNAMQGMNPAQMQQMMQMMNMQQGGMGGNMGGGPRPPAGPSAMTNRGFSAQEQNAFEQQKYEHQTRRGGPPSGPKGHHHQGGPQSWEGMYDDVPQPDASSPAGGSGSVGGPRRNNTPLNGKPPKGPTPTPQPSNAPANAPTGPKNAGKPGANFRGGGHGGRGRYHPYGR